MDYAKRAKAIGVNLSFGAPTRIEADAIQALRRLPTVYRYKENANPMREEGQITAVIRRQGNAWR